MEDSEITGFAWWAWGRSSDVASSRHGILVLTDTDIVEKRLAARTQFTVLVRDATQLSGWMCTPLSKFAPGQNKVAVYLRTGSNSWTPVPLVFEQLITALDRGVDVLAIPIQRLTVQIQFIKKRGKIASGYVDSSPVFDGNPTDWEKVSAFLAPFPLLSPLASADPPPVPVA